MLQQASHCFSCFNVLRLKAGQCEWCEAPPLMLLDPQDLLPLQFFAWSRVQPESLVEFAAIKTVLINFPKPQMSEDRYKLFLREFHSVLPAYINLAKEIRDGGAPSSGLGINPVAGTGQALEKISQLREFIFKPIIEAAASARATFAPVEAEYTLLEPHLILKDEFRRSFETQLVRLSFEIFYSSDRRERLQSHFDFGHKAILQIVSENHDGFAGLRALQRYAFFENIDDVATLLVYLKTGESYSEFTALMAEQAFALGYANPNGQVRPLTDAVGLEKVLQIMGWQTFRKNPRKEKPEPVRLQLDRNCLRKSILALKGRHTVIDSYIGLALEENGEPVPAELLAATNDRAKADADFAMARLLVARPMDTDALKTFIVKNSVYKPLGWIVGWVDREIQLPGLEKDKLDEYELGELSESLRGAAKTLMQTRKPVLSGKVLENVRKHAIEIPRRRTEWEKDEGSAPLKDSLLNLLIFHETDHKNLCYAFTQLSAPAETFWIRSDIVLDDEFFAALTSKDDWGYRVTMFFSEVARIPAEQRPETLRVEPSFIHAAFDWFVKKHQGNFYDLEKFWTYLDSQAQVHKSPSVLEAVFISWLKRMGLSANIYAKDALNALSQLSRARLRACPESRNLGAALEATIVQGEVPAWRAGLVQFIKTQAHERLEGSSALAMKMLLEDEGLLEALHKAMGEQEFINTLMDILLMQNLDNAGLFSAYFAAAVPIVKANPNAGRLKQLRARATSLSFIENKVIQELVMNFVSQWPDPDELAAERERAQKAADRAAEQAHLNAKLSAVDEMLAKLDAAHEVNVKAEQKKMQDSAAAAAAKLTAAIMSGDAAKMAEAQAKFGDEMQKIQDEGRQKIQALIAGLLQAKELMRKIG